jgi:hypothetical protein
LHRSTGFALAIQTDDPDAAARRLGSRDCPRWTEA